MAKKNPYKYVTWVLVGILVLGLISGFIIFGNGDGGGVVGSSIGYDDLNKDVKTFILDKSWSGFTLIDARPERCYDTSAGGVSQSHYQCYMSIVNNFVWAIPSQAPNSFVGAKITCTCLER